MKKFVIRVAAGFACAAAPLLAGCPEDAPLLCELGECRSLEAPSLQVTPDAAIGAEAEPPVGGTIYPPDCAATPKENASVVRDRCGVFVATSGTDTNPGTQTSPVRTLARAITLAKDEKKRVFLCAGTYDGPLSLGAEADGLGVHGGFVCPGSAEADGGTGNAPGSGWSYVGTSATTRVVRKEPGKPALVIRALKAFGTVVEDIEFSAADGASPGGSSLGGLIADSTGVVLRRVTVRAGKGADGADGAAPTGVAPAPVAVGSTATREGGKGNLETGGAGALCKCGDEETRGGRGADWAAEGKPGAQGEAARTRAPYPYPVVMVGEDGKGGAGAPTTVGRCESGNPGAQAPQAAVGEGATLVDVSLQGDDLLATGGAGGAGQAGSVGQGGGGGGSIRKTDYRGAGGGGGCGGCGGSGGSPGGAGGASVALAVENSSAELLEGCELYASEPGSGGEGSNGLAGGAGYEGGAGDTITGSCSGGSGGRGGTGGRGGGGGGGASIALLFRGPSPATASAKLIVGTPGRGGNAGGADGGVPAGVGAMGFASPTREVTP